MIKAAEQRSIVLLYTVSRTGGGNERTRGGPRRGKDNNGDTYPISGNGTLRGITSHWKKMNVSEGWADGYGGRRRHIVPCRNVIAKSLRGLETIRTPLRTVTWHLRIGIKPSEAVALRLPILGDISLMPRLSAFKGAFYEKIRPRLPPCVPPASRSFRVNLCYSRMKQEWGGPKVDSSLRTWP